MNKMDNFVGILGAAIGLIGLGYAMGTHSKMAQIGDNLNLSIDELAGKTPVSIPDSMVEKAVEKAVAQEVKQVVSKTTDRVVVDVKRDIHKQVSDAVEKEYSDIKGAVLEEVTTEAAKIDVKRVRADVEKAATQRALDKFDDNLDDILKNFNTQLNNTGKIYTSIADNMRPYRSNEGGAVFRIG